MTCFFFFDSSGYVDAQISEKDLIKGQQAAERGDVERCVYDQLLNPENHISVQVSPGSPPVVPHIIVISPIPCLVLVSLMPLNDKAGVCYMNV